MHQTILQKLAQYNKRRKDDWEWPRFSSLLINKGILLSNFWEIQFSQCYLEPIAEPRIVMSPFQILINSGSKFSKHASACEEEISSHFERFTKRPRFGPSSLMMAQAFKTSSIFPKRLPSSIYQLLRDKLGTQVRTLLTRTWRTKQKRNRHKASPCWTVLHPLETEWYSFQRTKNYAENSKNAPTCRFEGIFRSTLWGRHLFAQNWRRWWSLFSGQSSLGHSEILPWCVSRHALLLHPPLGHRHIEREGKNCLLLKELETTSIFRSVFGRHLQ